LAEGLFCKTENNTCAMKRSYLGELEEIVLLTIAILGEEAYGVKIMEEIAQQTGRSLSISAIHATLHRLEDKGLVNSYMGGATAERGGRRKRFFTVNQAGSRILHELKQLRQQLWQQVPAHALEWKMG
jgi:PadR family transcriptional regulator, regulatory protein PadR